MSVVLMELAPMCPDDSEELAGCRLKVGADGTARCLVPGSRLVCDLRQSATSPIKVRVDVGRAGLLALEHDWRTLAATLPQPCFNHSFDWQWAYLEYLETHPEAVRYVSFFHLGDPIAIFPLRRVRRALGGIPLWMWELPTHPHLVLCDPLIAPPWNTAVLICLLIRTLNQCRDLPWDALHLPNLLDDSVVVRQRLAASLSMTHQEKVGRSMYFECSDLDTALVNCSSGFKRNLRRQGKKLAQHGTVTLTLARRGNELESAFADFLRLEASGWKGGDGKLSAIALHPHLLGFYGELKQRFTAADACLISILKLDGVAIAAQFCLYAGSTLYIQKIAYDEAWSAEAPGSQLMYRLLEYCCGDPRISRLSLVTGPEWAVGRWNPECQDVLDVYVFRPCPRAILGLTLRILKTKFWMPAQRWWSCTAIANYLSREST